MTQDRPDLAGSYTVYTDPTGVRWQVLTWSDGTASLHYRYPDDTVTTIAPRRAPEKIRAILAQHGLPTTGWPA